MNFERFFPTRKRVPRETLMKARPLRNEWVEWELSEDGNALLVAPLDKQAKPVFRALARWSKTPANRQFELEPVGTFVWQRCDGQTSTAAIAKALQKEYKMNRLEAETALFAFLEMLSQRRLITMQFPKSS